MNLYRLSYVSESEPEPGHSCPAGDASASIDSVASALAPFGVSIVDSPVHQVVLIDLTRQIDLPLIEHVLRSAGQRVLHLDRATERDFISA